MTSSESNTGPPSPRGGGGTGATGLVAGDPAVSREVEGVAQDFSRHFALEYVADGSLVPDSEPPGWPPQDPSQVQMRAGSVGEVTRRPGDVGVLALDGHNGVYVAAPTCRPRSRCCEEPAAWCWICGATAAEIGQP